MVRVELPLERRVELFEELQAGLVAGSLGSGQPVLGILEHALVAAFVGHRPIKPDGSGGMAAFGQEG
ncbi:MAG TPA: hypothetical protein VE712_05010 [Actinomycetota bacterium]|nr:hypothetical protein [Actinomycetota bacterium]